MIAWPFRGRRKCRATKQRGILMRRQKRLAVRAFANPPAPAFPCPGGVAGRAFARASASGLPRKSPAEAVVAGPLPGTMVGPLPEVPARDRRSRQAAFLPRETWRTSRSPPAIRLWDSDRHRDGGISGHRRCRGTKGVRGKPNRIEIVLVHHPVNPLVTGQRQAIGEPPGRRDR